MSPKIVCPFCKKEFLPRRGGTLPRHGWHGPKVAPRDQCEGSYKDGEPVAR